MDMDMDMSGMPYTRITTRHCTHNIGSITPLEYTSLYSRDVGSITPLKLRLRGGR
jgi:hypothetical protein